MKNAHRADSQADVLQPPDTKFFVCEDIIRIVLSTYRAKTTDAQQLHTIDEVSSTSAVVMWNVHAVSPLIHPLPLSVLLVPATLPNGPRRLYFLLTVSACHTSRIACFYRPQQALLRLSPSPGGL